MEAEFKKKKESRRANTKMTKWTVKTIEAWKTARERAQE